MFAKCFKGIAVLAAGLLAGMAGDAATLFETTEVLADNGTGPLLTEPATFTVTVAGNYTITLRDLQTPVPLGSLEAIVASDLKVVGRAEVIYPTGGAAPTPASATFQATPGTYRVHVVGAARTGEPGGAFGVTVTAADGAAVVERAGTVAAVAAPASGKSVLQTKFDIAEAGTYEVALIDRAFPAALSAVRLLLINEADASPVATLSTAGQLQFTAAAGRYELFVIADSDVAANAGLYSVAVSTVPAISTVFAATQPVGGLLAAALLNVSAAGQYTFTLADAKFPAELNSLSAVVVQHNAVVRTMAAAGTETLSLAQGDLQFYIQAVPAAAAGIGAYKMRLAQGTQIVDARTQVADASPAAGTPAIFSFSSRSAVAAGPRRLTVKDFAFPQALASLQSVVVQGDTISEVRDGSGTLDVTLRAEPVRVLIAAKAAGSTNALFGFTLATQSLGAVDLESTQGVGDLFKSQPVEITKAGRYDLTLADLQFPASLRTAALAVTNGTTLVGQIFGGGSIASQQLDPGTYVLNFLGQPASAEDFGSYGLKVADSPAPAAITFTASPTTVQAGQKTTLQWTATNATTCTASNGWSGVRAVSGSVESEALQATTTFELNCSGVGGNTSSAVTVTVAAASKKGGGGSMDAFVLACLGAFAVTVGLRRQRR